MSSDFFYCVSRTEFVLRKLDLLKLQIEPSNADRSLLILSGGGRPLVFGAGGGGGGAMGGGGGGGDGILEP